MSDDANRYSSKASCPPRSTTVPTSLDQSYITRDDNNSTRAIIRRFIVQRIDCKGAQDYAFIISVTAAPRDRGDESRSVIMAELQEMLENKVWHKVCTNDLTSNERKAVIRSSMFLKV
jgi:hypothetical protein